MLKGKTIVLGITGGIAAYKAADIASRLTQAGAKVRVIMTKSALEFITPLTLHSLTMNAVVTDVFNMTGESRISHVALGEAADVLVIAPATANIIAKIAGGIADDMLTCTVLATRAPVIVAPSMHTQMFLNPVTQENIAKLQARGFFIIDPASGRLASGGFGPGRFPDAEVIIGNIQKVLGRNGDLAKKRIVVTAGGTQEPIDPVRVISNRSSGKMGYALAEAARDRGAEVVLITAPTALPKPVGVEVISVETASQMQEAVEKAMANADALLMAAAVADYQVKSVAKSKIKKEAGGLTLELVRTPDILSEVKGSFIRVGFAAESDNLIENARKKLESKQLDLIVANDITEAGSGFGTDTNKVTLIGKDGKAESLPLLPKREVAEKILDRVVGITTRSAELLYDSFEVVLCPSHLGQTNSSPYIPVPAAKVSLFPKNERVQLEIGNIEITDKFSYYGKDGKGLGLTKENLSKWLNTTPKPEVGDKLRITVVERMKKYHLELLKQGLSKNQSLRV